MSEAELEAGSFDTVGDSSLIRLTMRQLIMQQRTYVPPYEKKAKLIIESEDHTTRNEFVINLDASSESGEDPAYAGQDYDVRK